MTKSARAAARLIVNQMMATVTGCVVLDVGRVIMLIVKFLRVGLLRAQRAN